MTAEASKGCAPERTDLQTAGEVLARIEALRRGARHLVALAGAPGSGKSTLADALLQRLNAASPGRAAILPMDGYHYDDRVLSARGLLPRKGAPETFDVGGLRSILGRLRANTEAEIAVPVFDREIEISRAGASIIPRSCEVILAEGNYLLLDEGPWAGLADSFDLTAFVHVPEAELRRRLLARWHGFGLDAAQALAKAEENDLPNGRRVARGSVRAQLRIDGTGPLA